MDIVALLVQVVLGTLILSFVLWFAGRVFVGKIKAKFTDALWIAFLGTLIDELVAG